MILRILSSFFLLSLFLILSIFISFTNSYAQEPSNDEIRQYVRNTYKITSGTDALLDEALSQHPSYCGTSNYLELFKVMITTDDLINDLRKGDWHQLVAKGLKFLADLAISGTWAGDMISSISSVSGLCTLPYQITIDAFLDTAVKVAWNNQMKLYIRARQLGYSYQQVIDEINTDDILFDDGWLIIVGELRIPDYGGVRPGNFDRETVYAYAEKAYSAYTASTYYERNKAAIGEEFKKLIEPHITYMPSSPTAPADITFSVSGSMLTELNIISYAWDFGDNQTGDGFSVVHYFKAPGSYNVTLTMTDNSG
jgi:hypothetical protein